MSSVNKCQAVSRRVPRSARLYHVGFRGKVARTNLAASHETRDWRIFADFAQVLIAIARPLCASDPIGMELEQSLYALDSTTIGLCLSMFPWAGFRKGKAAVRMHTLLDLHGNIPTFISITDGKVHDVNILDEILPEAGAFCVMDRGYVDFGRLFVFTQSLAFFVVRSKANVKLQCRYSHPADRSTGVRSDHTVILTTVGSASLPGPAAASHLCRSGNQQAAHVPYQQSHPSGTYHRQNPQVSLAGRAILQMDQTASENQSFLWYQ